jgi:hypothetical protein
MTVSTSTWRPARGLATWLTVTLAAEAVLSVLGVGQGTPRSLDGYAAGIDALLHGHDQLAQTRFNHASDGSSFQVSQLVGYVAIVVLVLFIIWQWRSQHNALAHGRVRARISPGWGIAGWLVPFVNLVVPYLAIQDVWRSSDEQSAPGDGWRALPGSPLVSAWWVALVVGTAVPAVVTALVLATPRTAADTDWLTHAGSAVLAIGCVLGIFVVRDVTARQEQMQERSPAPTTMTTRVVRQDTGYGNGGPGWYPDPLGRFEHRYWDGAIWTEWVSTDGQLAIDTEPVPGYD